MAKVFFNREDLLYEIAGMAYVVADVKVGQRSDHELHQTFDICEPGNVERVGHILSLAFIEATNMASALLRKDSAKCRAGFRLMFRQEVDHSRVQLVGSLVKEYLIARVLDDWLTVTLPEAASVWNDKWRRAASAIRSASLLLPGCARRIPPL